MNFKIWVEEQEMSLGGMSPEMMTNRGSDTPASDEVKRTNMQPQVDAQEPKSAQDADRVLAIDAALEDLDNQLKEKIPEDSNGKPNEFKKLWDSLREKWDKIKMDAPKPEENQGLGMATGNPNYMKMMQQHPNMMPANAAQLHGPGTFGNQ